MKEHKPLKLPIKNLMSNDIVKLIDPKDGGTFFAETAEGEFVLVERNTDNCIIKISKKNGKREFWECVEYDNNGLALCSWIESGNNDFPPRDPVIPMSRHEEKYFKDMKTKSY